MGWVQEVDLRRQVARRQGAHFIDGVRWRRLRLDIAPLVLSGWHEKHLEIRPFDA